MRKQVTWMIVVTVVTGLAVVWTARADTPDFDLRQSQEEIEVMKGILRTTLSFASAELEGELARTDWERTQIEGYYLVGQGAVFVISVPSPRGRSLYTVGGRGGASLLYRDSGYVVSSGGTAAEDYTRASAAGDTGGAEVAADALAAERAAAAAERAPREDRAESRSRRSSRRVLEDLRQTEEESARRREEEEKLRQERITEYEAQVEVLKNRLVTTLARHGDSLLQVGADEYVTIILSPGSGGIVSFFGTSERQIPSEIISVEKATIRDYKAGRLSEEAFGERVLQYRN
jgi:hypothetical protein